MPEAIESHLMTKPIKESTMRIVQSSQNERLKALRHALQHKGRTRKDSDGQMLVGIEGENLILEAVRSQVRIMTLFVTQTAAERLDPTTLDYADEVLVVEDSLLAEAVSTETPQSVAALVQAPEFNETALYLGSPLIVVSAGLQDPGNLGTLIRSAEAFGATGLIAMPGTVSEWNPKSLRASAGSAFRLPILHWSEEETMAAFAKAGVPVFAAIAEGQDAAEYDLNKPVALVIGNEGNGLTPEFIARCAGKISIPCPGPVESLNAAAAASILLYETSRQRSAVRKGLVP